MHVRGLGLVFAAAAAVAIGACADSPSRPSMSFAAPVAEEPSNDAAYNFNQQPISLQIINSVRTGSAAVTYNVEVSSDDAFSALAFASDGVGEGTGGTTSVQLPPLDGNRNYFWRWRAVVDGTVGEPSPTRKFFLRPNIILGIPDIRQPADGGAVYGARPTFIVGNSTVAGPAGQISYEFQVSDSAAFGQLLAMQTVSAQPNETAWNPTTDLPEGNLFWRARARDLANGVDGPFSDAAGFERRFGLDLKSVVYALGPDISDWPQTATLTEWYKAGDTVCTFYDKSWPNAPFLGDPNVAVVANQWVFVNVGGIWYGGAGHWLRPGQACKTEYDDAFFVDGFAGRFPFNNLVLRSGDVFGVAVSTPARFYPADKTLDERSDVQFLVW